MRKVCKSQSYECTFLQSHPKSVLWARVAHLISSMFESLICTLSAGYEFFLRKCTDSAPRAGYLCTFTPVDLPRSHCVHDMARAMLSTSSKDETPFENTPSSHAAQLDLPNSFEYLPGKHMLQCVDATED